MIPEDTLNTRRPAHPAADGLLPDGAGPARTARVEAREEGGELVVTVSGDWRLREGRPASCDAVVARIRPGATRGLRVQARDLGEWDSALLAFLMDLVGSAMRAGCEVRRDLPGRLERLVSLTFAVKSKEGSGRTGSEKGLATRVGEAVLSLGPRLGDVCAFLGEVALGVRRALAGKSSMRMVDLVGAMYECGIGSLGIVALTNTLFGLILAFVGAVQLRAFGAEIYTAGLVGIGMLRVMGAVMVGIVMSGRIGASYAALIGTMQVNEEVDALETMGVPPVEFLVLPRLLALVIMTPILTVFADVFGIFGGFLVSVSMLGVGPVEYLAATTNMVGFGHGIVGLAYATVFGVVIAVSGCYHGMRCGRSAQAVGRATTTAVVHSIVGIIVATAFITVICNVAGV